MTASWRQFRIIPYDATVARVVGALAVEIPDEGRPLSFAAEGFQAARTSAGDWVVLVAGSARPVNGPREVLRAAKLPAGTPSGDALRQWLKWWGWVPKSEQTPAEARQP